MSGKRACTVSPKTGAFPHSSPPISASSRLSSRSKRCEVEVSERPSLLVVSKMISEQVSD